MRIVGFVPTTMSLIVAKPQQLPCTPCSSDFLASVCCIRLLLLCVMYTCLACPVGYKLQNERV